MSTKKHTTYLRWVDDVRREPINGIIHVMSALCLRNVKTETHQIVKTFMLPYALKQ
jgi:hypothetical protein